jgi:hypothetical protein
MIHQLLQQPETLLGVHEVYDNIVIINNTAYKTDRPMLMPRKVIVTRITKDPYIIILSKRCTLEPICRAIQLPKKESMDIISRRRLDESNEEVIEIMEGITSCL